MRFHQIQSGQLLGEDVFAGVRVGHCPKLRHHDPVCLDVGIVGVTFQVFAPVVDLTWRISSRLVSGWPFYRVFKLMSSTLGASRALHRTSGEAPLMQGPETAGICVYIHTPTSAHLALDSMVRKCAYLSSIAMQGHWGTSTFDCLAQHCPDIDHLSPCVGTPLSMPAPLHPHWHPACHTGVLAMFEFLPPLCYLSLHVSNPQGRYWLGG